MIRKILAKTLLSAPLLISAALPFGSQASDHIDWPEGSEITFPHLDIADLYTWTPKKNKLALALTFHSGVQPDTGFVSDNVEYRFTLRPVILEERANAQVLVPKLIEHDPGTTITCTEEDSVVTCSTLDGPSASAELDTVKRFKRRAPMQLFAGTVFDPFGIDLAWGQTRVLQTTNNFDPEEQPGYIGPVPLENPVNTLEGFLVNAITVVIDVPSVLGKAYTHYAVAGGLYYNGELFDSMGRAETNLGLIRSPDFQALYNGTDTFQLNTDTDLLERKALFSTLLSAGVAGWDKLDKKLDWEGENAAALVEGLLLDALIVNVKDRCKQDDRFLNLLRATGPLQHYNDKCGGKTLSEDYIDTFASFFTAGPQALKDLFGDGIDGAGKKRAKRRWPYFISASEDRYR